MFNFEIKHLKKSPTSIKRALRLADEIMTDGFVTAADPLQILHGSDSEMKQVGLKTEAPWVEEASLDVIPPLSNLHHKSQGRVAMLQMIVSMIMDDEVNLKEIHPVLWQSVREMRCVALQFGSVRQQVFANFKVSARGDIRTAANDMDWYRFRKNTCEEPGEVLRSWNSTCSKSQAMVGVKAQALKNLLEKLLEEAVDEIDSIISI